MRRHEVVEKEEELSKKDVHLAILMEKQAELDDLAAQMDSQKRLLGILKKDNDLLELRAKTQASCAG